MKADSSKVQTGRVAQDDDGIRLDRWFKKHHPSFGYSGVEKALRKGQIRLDGARAKGATRVAAGQEVRIPPYPMRPRALTHSGARAEALTLSPEERDEIRSWILYKDDWVLALNKPAGLAVQGGSGQMKHLDAMLEALRYNAAERPRLVHRLDKDTSGLLLLACNATAARKLAKNFENKRAHKLYLALVRQYPAQKKGWISLPLLKQTTAAGDKMVVDEGGGKEALTLYQGLEKARGGIGWIALMPLTGRRHQLRVHCAASKAPILGDGKYGGRDAYPYSDDFPKNLMLHAAEISMPHPQDGTTLRVRAPLHGHMKEALEQLGLEARRGFDAVDLLEDYARDLAHCPPRPIRDFFKQ